MHIRFIITAVCITLLSSSCISSVENSSTEVVSRAYIGHENDRDIYNFVQQYPQTAGTRLDDCQTCHRSGVADTDTEREFSPCGYCHLIEFPNPRYETGVPDSFGDTLNAYGLAYRDSGRSLDALAMIAESDSDDDGFINSLEISEERYPGDSSSRPGQPMAPFSILGWDEISKLPTHTQFMLMNRTTQQYDLYTVYSGVRIKDLIKAAGVDLTGAAGITVFAPDGYSIDYTLEDVLQPFPKARFYSTPGTIEEEQKRFVQYPDSIPAGLKDGEEIPDELWLLLAFEQDGSLLRLSHYNKENGHLVGDGPYRLIKPQHNAASAASRSAGPDRAVRSERYGDGWDYSEAIGHNAGNCVRGATVIRINPMPEGYEEYDWKNGLPLIESREIVVFGRGVVN